MPELAEVETNLREEAAKKCEEQLIDYVEDHNMYLLIGMIEVTFICVIVTLVFVKNTFKHLEKLFINIHNGETPFTMENVEHIKKMSYLLIVVIILSCVSGVLSEFIFKQDFSYSIDLTDLIYILCLYSLSYIFEYGYEIQLDSKGKMYGEEESE